MLFEVKNCTKFVYEKLHFNIMIIHIFSCYFFTNATEICRITSVCAYRTVYTVNISVNTIKHCRTFVFNYYQFIHVHF